MAALAFDTTTQDGDLRDDEHRSGLLRWLDRLAEMQIRHSVDVIGRAQRARASNSNVTQPSSSIER